MTGSDRYAYSIIIRALDDPEGQASQAALEAWLAADTHNRMLYEKVKSLWEQAAEAAAYEDTNADAATDRFMQLLARRYPAVAAPRLRRVRPGRYAAAAAVLGLAAIAYWWMRPAPLQLTTLRTADKMDSVILSDGTKIVLRHHSAVRYPVRFGGKARQVYLDEGAAFFDVRQDAEHPFTATTGELDVDVLGTAFNLSTTGSKIKLYVLNGEVSFGLKSDPAPLLLSAGNGASWQKSTGALADSGVNYNELAWKTRELHFVDMPMETVCNLLSEYYQVKIVLQNDTRRAQKLNANFSQSSIDEVLQTLNVLYDYRYEKRGDTIFIR